MSPEPTEPAHRRPNRIISLLPGATEIVAALGAADRLVSISHECDFPEAVLHLPRITTTPIDPLAASGAIDAAVRDLVAHGRQVIEVDRDQLLTLAPDMIITQRLCDVCAVSDGVVMTLAEAMPVPPLVFVMTGTTLAGVAEDMRRLGVAIGREEAGDRLALNFLGELAWIRSREARVTPSVVVIEWLDPLYLAGHWTPELVACAGGVDVGARPGDHSVRREWSDVIALDPDLVVLALCGFGPDRARMELSRMPEGEAKRWLMGRRLVIIDGNAWTSRAGPRLVEGARAIAAELTRLDCR